jgi:putative photosynthetic complex assembly protein 2
MSGALPWPVFVVFATWWASTGLVLGLVWLGPALKRGTMALATLTAGAGLAGVLISRTDDSMRGVYLAFASALALWAWHELAFLLGVVTGPWRERCPTGVTGWRRFAFATRAVIHHELALALTLLVLLGLTWGHPNALATATFASLWAMRLSTKLNIFLGVRQLTEEFIPEHLQYLRSFFRPGKITALLPASIVAGALLACAVLASALAPDLADGPRLGRLVVGTLLALGVLEHVFLAVPLREAALWRWALRARGLVPK